MNLRYRHLGLLGLLTLAMPMGTRAQESNRSPAAMSGAPSQQVRQELLEARETAWRSFFQEDLSVIESILAPELIAIQESSEPWADREGLISIAKSMGERGVQLTRLEFPRTEIQLFGDTAILYYMYIMEQRLGDRVAVHAGRGTEIFVRRNGKWVDVGWHLDNGAFQRQDGAWVRLGEPVPDPISQER
jgi:hypothetical protein